MPRRDSTEEAPNRFGAAHLNPADAYRLLNLTGFANVSMFAGMAGLSGQSHLGQPVLLAALALWVVLPLGLATGLFARRQL